MRRGLGFTLIELMVTIAVLAVIAMMAAPSFTNLRDKQLLDSTTKELEGLLIQARSDAILRRHKVVVNLGESGVATPTNLYWTTLNSEAINFIKFTCENKVFNGQPMMGTNKLEFGLDGRTQLVRTYINNSNNSVSENLSTDTIEIKLIQNNTNSYIEISPFGKVSVNKESKQGEECE
ncbi:prepilin-type N-terminal cleavage/methylation domain-containing protein [Acinetobacter sp. WU_MDCI_Axc73]|nr:prepilin-type N-terminal cleavage/methylation domain-containing protein [Acinetobacter sp. WU_MDCI_Axc73]